MSANTLLCVCLGLADLLPRVQLCRHLTGSYMSGCDDQKFLSDIQTTGSRPLDASGSERTEIARFLRLQLRNVNAPVDGAGVKRGGIESQGISGCFQGIFREFQVFFGMFSGCFFPVPFLGILPIPRANLRRQFHFKCQRATEQSQAIFP